MTIEKEWTQKGLKCKIIRNPHLGILCGYVAVPSGHPDWGKEEEEIDVDVHGGLTFAKQGGLDPRWENKNFWWFGFDCGHAFDFIPGIFARLPPELKKREPEEHEWTVEEVFSETNKLAKQLYQRRQR